MYVVNRREILQRLYAAGFVDRVLTLSLESISLFRVHGNGGAIV